MADFSRGKEPLPWGAQVHCGTLHTVVPSTLLYPPHCCTLHTVVPSTLWYPPHCGTLHTLPVPSSPQHDSCKLACSRDTEPTYCNKTAVATPGPPPPPLLQVVQVLGTELAIPGGNTTFQWASTIGMNKDNKCGTGPGRINKCVPVGNFGLAAVFSPHGKRRWWGLQRCPTPPCRSWSVYGAPVNYTGVLAPNGPCFTQYPCRGG